MLRIKSDWVVGMQALVVTAAQNEETVASRERPSPTASNGISAREVLAFGKGSGCCSPLGQRELRLHLHLPPTSMHLNPPSQDNHTISAVVAGRELMAYIPSNRRTFADAVLDIRSMLNPVSLVSNRKLLIQNQRLPTRTETQGTCRRIALREPR
ncbi:hypothetical protein Hypma_001648 [Hypsizygus marmoreus]|uniref:Uncharacterized protein n=1 Tax=Hypsizygus marmoreus TaxID=39966 RepID=A0A369JCA2_HYPMA|nr:hypothetical protein Hypma_001648 [Hypsizygus marmoreus]